MNDREAFEQWIKKEHPHIYSGSLKDDEDSVRFKMDVDFMFSAWQASANRQGYKLVPVEPTEEMVDAGVEESDVDWKRLKFAYQAMIGEETK